MVTGEALFFGILSTAAAILLNAAWSAGLEDTCIVVVIMEKPSFFYFTYVVSEQ
jgi:hypothetical protein